MNQADGLIDNNTAVRIYLKVYFKQILKDKNPDHGL